MLNVNLNAYLKSLNHGMFATRDNAKEGIEYAYNLIESLPKKYRLVAFTALHVSINTISSDISKLIDEKQ